MYVHVCMFVYMRAAMVKRFPLCVNSTDSFGDTLYHYAVRREDDRLLAILLRAELPRFWLPANHRGEDILQVGGTTHVNRCCCCCCCCCC